MSASKQVPPEECANKRRLLIGNGHSIGCLDSFRYSALYQKITDSGLPAHIQDVFSHFGESNFEAVLRALDDGAWMATHYGMINTDTSRNMLNDYSLVKNYLADAISSVHPINASRIPGRKYEASHSFFSHFDDIYSLNYDLLAYWTVLSKDPHKFCDGFFRDEDTPLDCCEYMPEKTRGKPRIYWLHGALHLYTDGGSVRKRVWEGTGINLIDQIREALNRKEYPLFVAEGDSLSKLKKIEASSYLFDCLDKFSRIQGQLFIYGHSLPAQDQHILDMIAKNIELRHLWISLHGAAETPSNQNIILAAEKIARHRQSHIGTQPMTGTRGGINIHYFDSDSASVGGDTPAI